MNELHIEAAQSTPEIKATASDAGALIEMRGDSYPENTFEFFAPLTNWIDEFLAASSHSIRFDLYLLYLNTSSVKVMMDIFDALEDAHGTGRQVAVAWHYDGDNERIAELAEEFKEDCTFPFEIIRQA